jgi:hypothetical protein
LQSLQPFSRISSFCGVCREQYLIPLPFMIDLMRITLIIILSSLMMMIMMIMMMMMMMMMMILVMMIMIMMMMFGEIEITRRQSVKKSTLYMHT